MVYGPECNGVRATSQCKIVARAGLPVLYRSAGQSAKFMSFKFLLCLAPEKF